MIKCKDCRYWERNEESYKDHKYGSCDCPLLDYGSSCDVYDNSNMLIYWDYEEYAAGFMTGENFGCIHGQAMNDKRK